MAEINTKRLLAPLRPASGELAPGDDGGALRGAEIEATLELAYLMANANGDASFDELASFRILAKALAPQAEVNELLDKLSERMHKADSFEVLVRDAAKNLARPTAREIAYKAAYAVAVMDLETNEEERELDDLLIEVLELDARVGELERDVNEALMVS
ncbi:MAG: hypothetical protein JST00_15545 [Deltaproteobacteria bacterium]|nr:hypothetical protein [Deltaproteobacteria bacterium]